MDFEVDISIRQHLVLAGETPINTSFSFYINKESLKELLKVVNNNSNFKFDLE